MTLVLTPKQFQERLDRAGVTQAELARRIDVQPLTVNRWARGKCTVPGAVVLLLDLWAERRAQAIQYDKT